MVGRTTESVKFGLSVEAVLQEAEPYEFRDLTSLVALALRPRVSERCRSLSHVILCPFDSDCGGRYSAHWKNVTEVYELPDILTITVPRLSTVDFTAGTQRRTFTPYRIPQAMLFAQAAPPNAPATHKLKAECYSFEAVICHLQNLDVGTRPTTGAMHEAWAESIHPHLAVIQEVIDAEFGTADGAKSDAFAFARRLAGKLLREVGSELYNSSFAGGDHFVIYVRLPQLQVEPDLNPLKLMSATAGDLWKQRDWFAEFDDFPLDQYDIPNRCRVVPEDYVLKMASTCGVHFRMHRHRFPEKSCFIPHEMKNEFWQENGQVVGKPEFMIERSTLTVENGVRPPRQHHQNLVDSHKPEKNPVAEPPATMWNVYDPAKFAYLRVNKKAQSRPLLMDEYPFFKQLAAGFGGANNNNNRQHDHNDDASEGINNKKNNNQTTSSAVVVDSTSSSDDDAHDGSEAAPQPMPTTNNNNNNNKNTATTNFINNRIGSNTNIVIQSSGSSSSSSSVFNNKTGFPNLPASTATNHNNNNNNNTRNNGGKKSEPDHKLIDEDTNQQQQQSQQQKKSVTFSASTANNNNNNGKRANTVTNASNSDGAIASISPEGTPKKFDPKRFVAKKKKTETSTTAKTASAKKLKPSSAGRKKTQTTKKTNTK